jgi:hypothetical protein
MAIVQHTTWKGKLKGMVDSGVKIANYDPNPEHCEFGKWMLAQPAEFQASQHFHTVDELHRRFHAEADKIVAAAIGGDKARAHAALDYGSAFDHTSQQLVQAIIAWHDNLSGKS